MWVSGEDDDPFGAADGERRLFGCVCLCVTAAASRDILVTCHAFLNHVRLSVWVWRCEGQLSTRSAAALAPDASLYACSVGARRVVVLLTTAEYYRRVVTDVPTYLSSNGPK
jgi:hypothetical protein